MMCGAFLSVRRVCADLQLIALQDVIQRREETIAMRSLLNTDKVTEDNPMMLRLKELKALEAIAGKVDRLTVHDGTQGRLRKVIRRIWAAFMVWKRNSVRKYPA